MIGNLDTSRKEATVVGAGIAGLLAAYRLDRKGYRVTVLEQKQRAGGLLRTERTKYGIAEAAANSLLASPPVLQLCDELGVELAEVRKDSRARYILRKGKLRRFPLSPRETAVMLGRAAFMRASNHADILTLESWGQRHLGAAAVDYLLTPLVRGIYGLSPGEVGVMAAFPNLVVEPGKTLLGSLVRGRLQRGSSKQGRPHMVAPEHGMGDLVERLERHLVERLEDRFVKGTQVQDLPESPNILLATPADQAARLLKADSPNLAELLEQVQYTPLVSATGFVERTSLTKHLRGVGVLIPAREGRSTLGVLFSSSSFPGRVTDESRWVSFTVMMGGSNGEDWVHASDEQIQRAITTELSDILGLDGKPVALVINRWRRAIPRYSVNLPKVWQAARETWCATPGRILFGNYTGQVSLRGMIESAARLGETVQ